MNHAPCPTREVNSLSILKSLSGNTPFIRFKLGGAVKKTIRYGKVVYKGQQLKTIEV